MPDVNIIIKETLYNLSRKPSLPSKPVIITISKAKRKDLMSPIAPVSKTAGRYK
jgi:hypothetical protein